MSKQSEAKARQGYVDKAVPATCGNCAQFWSRNVVIDAGYVVEKDKTCQLGGFAVKKTATCRFFEKRKPVPTGAGLAA